MRMRMADGFEHFQLTGFNDGDGLRAGDGSRSEFRPRRERQSRFGSFAPGEWWKRHPAGFSNQTWRRHRLNRIGTYNPDWAILKHDDTVLYLVRETKGTKNFEKLRNSEAEKTRYGRKHFETLKVDFDVVTVAGEV
jgi:hypothetical protein